MAAELDLSQVGVGFSEWQSDGDAPRFRTLQGRAYFFVPTSACVLELPVRLAPGQRRDRVELEILMGGRLANRVTLVPGSWVNVSLIVPGQAARFRRVDLRAPGDSPVQVQKPALAECSSNR